MTQKLQCTVEGCKSPTRSRGLCSLHYNRWIQSGRIEIGPTEPKYQQAQGRVCALEECGRPVRAKMLCSTHYSRSLKSCPSCGGTKALASGLCRECYTAPPSEPPTHRVCTRCNQEKPVADFGYRKTGRGGTKINSRCRACNTEDARAYREALMASDPLEYTRRKEASRQKSAERAREREALGTDNDRVLRSLIRSARTLRIDPVIVLDAWEATGNRCQACGASCTFKRRVVIDHCHTSGVFRGLICTGCNVAAGHLQDSPDRARLLATYLEQSVIRR